MPDYRTKRVMVSIKHACHDIAQEIGQRTLTPDEYDNLVRIELSKQFPIDVAQILHKVTHWVLTGCGLEYQAGNKNGENHSRVFIKNEIIDTNLKRRLIDLESYNAISGRLPHDY
ncbi:hypothetical protein CL614_05015 [archaeon]|nr:hypothetical protein [archaeon]